MIVIPAKAGITFYPNNSFAGLHPNPRTPSEASAGIWNGKYLSLR
jgi:hypothetical protein